MELTLESLAARVESLERVLAQLAHPGDPPGTAGDPQSDDPVAVARWVAAFDAIPPVQMTAAEEAAWAADRAARRTADATALDRLAASLPGVAG